MLDDKAYKWRTLQTGKHASVLNGRTQTTRGKFDRAEVKETKGDYAKRGACIRLGRPPRVLRKLVRDRGDLSDKRFKSEKRSYIGALKFVPHALLKLLENMPMPWEPCRLVSVAYHISGAITCVDETPRVVEPVFIAQWSTVWVMMRREKRDRPHFKRMRIPAFDDDEPPLDWTDNLMHLSPPEAIRLPLDPVIDAAVTEWLYDRKPLRRLMGAINGPSYRRWQLSPEILSTLLRLSEPLLGGTYGDPNRFYLWNRTAFSTSKVLHAPLPGGPKFQALYDDEGTREDWDDFNDISKVIVRNPIKPEQRIAFPHLYNDRPRGVAQQRDPGPLRHITRTCDSVQATFSFDETFNPILGRMERSEILGMENDLPPMKLPRRFAPILGDEPLEYRHTMDGITLLQAPRPFMLPAGQTRRAVDVALVLPWYKARCPIDQPTKVKISYQKLLKAYVLHLLQREKPLSVRRRKLRSALKRTKFFHTTTIDWVEAGLQLCRQGHNMLNLLIRKKQLHYLHLDFNFNLKPTRTLSTKERKRSRFGNSFHLVREILKLIRMIVDCHVQYRLGHVDAFQLADGLQYLFSHVGQLTGIYRYKYKVMKQIRACKDLKHVIYSKFNRGAVGKGPGVGFWHPMWRVWVFFLRGTVPLLERWLGNMLARTFEGRESKRIVKAVTKQRDESHYDVELRASVVHDVLDMMPREIRQGKAKIVLAHLSEAWRCFKANIPWVVPGMPLPIEDLINRYVKNKADWWTRVTYLNRDHICKGKTVDKLLVKKNLGRLTRLWLKNEQDRQRRYLEEGPYVAPDDAVALYTSFVRWLESRHYTVIPFPPLAYKHDTKLLTLALERIKELYQGVPRLTSTQREELALVEAAYDNPQEAIARIKRQLLTSRSFKQVDIEFMDHFSHLTPVYKVDPLEKIADAYLDQYLWYEGDKRNLFPAWVKPADTEPAPFLVYKWAHGINNVQGAWDTANGAALVMLQTELEDMAGDIDLTLLNRLLRLVVDRNLADYMTSKNNVVVSFKDMDHTNSLGVIRGLQFAPFILQLYGLCMDLMILGLSRATEFAGSSVHPNVSTHTPRSLGTHHPIRLYTRYYERIYVLFKFSGDEAEDIVAEYLSLGGRIIEGHGFDYKKKRCWPRDCRMRLMKSDVALGKAVFWEVKNRLPTSLCSVNWAKSFASVYSRDNPNFLFDMCGFEVRILPKCRANEIHSAQSVESVWNLLNNSSKDVTASAFLRVSEESIVAFHNRVRQILMTSGNAPFTKIANKWNTAVIALVTYFREAIVHTKELLDLLVKCEIMVQNRIKSGLNTKMPTRFPPHTMYSTQELGGLGMLSMGHILVPRKDFIHGRVETPDAAYKRGIWHEEGSLIPNLIRYVQPWESEFSDSQRVWSEYAVKRLEAVAQNRRLSLEDLEDSWDRGLPRINTLFQKDRHILAYDKGWRCRMDFRKHTVLQHNPFWWTNQRHDGKLWNLNSYRADVIEALGGVEGILGHTLFAGTNFLTWDGLFWEKTSGFENTLVTRKLTNAQRLGISQIPNRRFTLWWSPTINRADVYVGFQVQLDLTGIFMHGKIPTLKVSLVQVFRAHLWQKIHESLVMDLCAVLDQHMEVLGAQSVEKEIIHPRKSYRMNFSCADIVLRAAQKWKVTNPSHLVSSNSRSDVELETVKPATKYWLDVQLRWGDFDTKDVDKYCKAKYLEYTSDDVSVYPSPHGAVITVDLCYNKFSGYGTWLSGSKTLLQQAMMKIMKCNPALYVLRERLRKALQLYSSEPVEPNLSIQNVSEIFGPDSIWFIDDTNVYRVTIHKTADGNISTRPINGAVLIFNPRTGQLFLKILHTKVWAGQSKLGQLAKWKTAEEVAALVRNLPVKDHPKQIIVTRRGMMDPLQVNMLEFPHIVLRRSDLKIPLQSFLKVDQIGDIVLKAMDSKLVSFDAYDDWLRKCSAFTSFSRLLLLLRALHVSTEKTKSLLRPDVSIVTAENHLWPSLTDDMWVRLEIALKDLILSDYGKRNNVNVSALTQIEIRDIVLGSDVGASSKRQQVARVDAKVSASEHAHVTSLTKNMAGEKIVVTTTSPYEQAMFVSKADWRARALAASSLHLRMKNIRFPDSVRVDSSIPALPGGQARCILPVNLLKRFVRVADVRTHIAALAFGTLASDGTRQVKCLLIPPQCGTHECALLPTVVPDHDLLRSLVPLGIVHTQQDSNDSRRSEELYARELQRLTEANAWERHGRSTGVISVTFAPGSISISAVAFVALDGEPSATGQRGQCRQAMAISLKLDALGFFLMPRGRPWNYNFSPGQHSVAMEYAVQMANPRSFYDEVHRAGHFRDFSNAGEAEEVPNVVENVLA